jgi:rod shape-determining protein MreC
VSIELASRHEGRLLYVVVALLLMHLTLISVQVEDPAGTLLFKKWVMMASAPALTGASRVTHGIDRLWAGYVWLVGTHAENERLKESVRQLALANSSLAQAEEENLRLRRLLGFRDGAEFRTLGARVVGRIPHYLSNILYLDRGSSDGVSGSLPVVTHAGVIGRTLLVTPSSAQVQLLTNADASIGVLIERTRVPGVVRGTENLLLELNYVANTEDVVEGDVLLTSGLDGIYPKGLPVGKIVRSEKGKSGFRTIRVEPVADMVRIEEVLILLDSPGLGAERAPAK